MAFTSIDYFKLKCIHPSSDLHLLLWLCYRECVCLCACDVKPSHSNFETTNENSFQPNLGCIPNEMLSFYVRHSDFIILNQFFCWAVINQMSNEDGLWLGRLLVDRDEKMTLRNFLIVFDWIASFDFDSKGKGGKREEGRRCSVLRPSMPSAASFRGAWTIQRHEPFNGMNHPLAFHSKAMR